MSCNINGNIISYNENFGGDLIMKNKTAWIIGGSIVGAAALLIGYRIFIYFYTLKLYEGVLANL